MIECDVDGGNCKSWCPDCDVARPSIDEWLKKVSRNVFKGTVQTKEEWVGNASHPYKLHHIIKARGVPSLILFEGQQELLRIDDLDDFKNDEMMKMMFEDE